MTLPWGLSSVLLKRTPTTLLRDWVLPTILPGVADGLSGAVQASPTTLYPTTLRLTVCLPSCRRNRSRRLLALCQTPRRGARRGETPRTRTLPGKVSSDKEACSQRTFA